VRRNARRSTEVAWESAGCIVGFFPF